MTEQLFHPPSADDPVPQDSRTPGAILRKLREEAGLSQAAVGSALHLTAHYIKALESDEYGKLPGLTFVKGYLRAYARFLKTDVDLVLECFDQHIASMVDAGQRTQQVQRSRRRQDQALRWAFATGSIIVVSLAGGWWYVGQDSADPLVTGGSAGRQSVQMSGTTIVPPANTAQMNPLDPAAGLALARPGAASPSDSAGQRSGEQQIAGNAGLSSPAIAGAYDPTNDTLADESLSDQNPTGASVAAGTLASGTLAVAFGQVQAAGVQVAGAEPQVNRDTTAVPTSLQASSSESSSDESSSDESSSDESSFAESSSAVASTSAAVTETAAAGTITRGNLTIVSADTGRLLTLAGTGQDLLQLSLNGNSWVEIEDGAHARLYNDMLRAGDALTVQGAAPFYVLLGDAHQVEVKLNSQVIDIVTSIRNDNTARLILDDAEQTDGVTN